MITHDALTSRVLNKLQDYDQHGTAVITISAEQAQTKRFKLPKEHLIEMSVTLAVTDVNGNTIVYIEGDGGPTGFGVEYNSGWVTLVTAPGAGCTITVTFSYRLFSSDDVTLAINQGLRHAWPYLPTRNVDTSITAITGTQEYVLPDDVAYIERLETSNDGGTTWSREYDWTTFETSNPDGDEVRMLRFLSGVTGLLRLRYVRRFYPITGQQQMQKDAHVKDAAAEPVVYYACWQLLYEQIIRRQREVAFLNDEGPNVPKVYEGMRFADGLRAACDGMLNEYRATPRLKGV